MLPHIQEAQISDRQPQHPGHSEISTLGTPKSVPWALRNRGIL